MPVSRGPITKAAQRSPRQRYVIQNRGPKHTTHTTHTTQTTAPVSVQQVIQTTEASTATGLKVAIPGIPVASVQVTPDEPVSIDYGQGKSSYSGAGGTTYGGL